MELLINLDPDSDLGLQNQIRQKLVEAILSGALPASDRANHSSETDGDISISDDNNPCVSVLDPEKA